MKKFILKHTPVLVQNVAISLYNTFLYRKRHRGSYQYYREYFAGFEDATIKGADRKVSG